MFLKICTGESFFFLLLLMMLWFVGVTVENDENILDNLFQRFQNVGLFPITAKDGYEGYMRACSENPDFIISE